MNSRARLTRRSLVCFFSVVLSFGLAANSFATPSSGSAAPAADEAAKEAPAPADPLGRDTPRGTFEGYIKAVAQENYARAAQYLDMDPLSFDKRIRSEQVARILQQSLDRSSNVPPAVMLSNDPKGQLDDDQPPELERIGSLEIEGKAVDLLLRRVQVGEEQVWLIASTTLDVLPTRITAEATLPLNQWMPESLLTNKWQGVPWGHWIAMLLIALASYALSRFTVGAVAGFVRLVLQRNLPEYPTGLVKAFAVPIQLFMAVWVFVAAAQRVGVSIIVRQNISQIVVIVGCVSVLWLIWRLVDVITSLSEKRMTTQNRFGALSAVVLLRRSTKVLLVIVGVIAALHTAGLDVTTGLAALGIGGIAVALGAQKMMENLVGSVSLVFDQPVRVGDFCRVGETLGTVEEIGMRSTRIRTLDRTIVTIPNGDFSAQKIENFAHRDRFLFRPVLALRYQTSPTQIRQLLAALRSLLESHADLDEGARARFLGFATSSLTIEIFAYVLARDYDHFLEVQEELNLSIADIVAASGTTLALPAQQVYLSREPVLASEAETTPATTAENVLPLREQDELRTGVLGQERDLPLAGTVKDRTSKAS